MQLEKGPVSYDVRAWVGAIGMHPNAQAMYVRYVEGDGKQWVRVDVPDADVLAFIPLDQLTVLITAMQEEQRERRREASRQRRGRRMRSMESACERPRAWTKSTPVWHGSE